MIRFEVSTRGIVLIVVSALLVWAFIELWSVIVLVLFSLILMIGLLPYVEALVLKGLPRGLAVAVVMAAVLIVTVALIGVMLPPIIDELTNVRDNLPNSAREVEDLLGDFGIEVQLQERAENIDWDGLISGRAAVDAGQRVLSTTISIITIIAMAAYLLADTPRLSRFFGQFIREDKKEEANQIFFSVSRVVGGYLRGQLITSLCIGLFTFLLLRIVGVPNPLAFAVLAGFADIIPIIGAFIAIIPPTAAALQDSSTKALIVLVTLVLYQQFEDRYLVPRVYGSTLNLPPIIVLIAVLAGAELLGVAGVLLALPLTAAGRVAVDYVIEHRRLPIIEGTDVPLAPDPPQEKKRRLRTAGRRLRRDLQGGDEEKRPRRRRISRAKA
jgi:predicted PurR-regulated permease PerM